MASAEVASGVFPELRKKALQDLLEFVKNAVSSQEDTSKTVDLEQDERHTWHAQFTDYFIVQDRGEDCDDLLFYVKSDAGANGTAQRKRANQKPAEDNPVDIVVCRKDFKSLPTVSDALVRWNETMYLNLIMQEFDYTLTVGVCSADSKPMQPLDVFALKSQRVYATPSLQRMDKKGQTSTMTYPLLYFTIDNFEEVFNDVAVQDNQKVVVQLTAFKAAYDALAVLFLGSVKYTALKRVFDAKASTASKLVSKASLGLWSGSQKRTEFVSMRGPRGQGRAQMAVSLNYVAAPPPPAQASSSGGAATSTASSFGWLRGKTAKPTGAVSGATISYHKRSGSGASAGTSDGTETPSDTTQESPSISSTSSSSNTMGNGCASDSTLANGNWEVINEEDHAGFDASSAGEEPSIDIHTQSPGGAETDGGAGVASRTLGWFMSPVSAVSKKLQDRGSSSACEMTSRLTYVMLPWHSILDEIIRPVRVPALPFHLDS
ncbi:uncharacterized protein KIAA0930 homolog [Sycon ciliatum]|uniref:uncharacterized protein KIAA0930 homolog n=1 Tax=Sycon ciliatum TaxID=27933 RepID=UPI0031F6EE13